jgi:exopolysaccharide production protein ExoQ
MPRQLALFLCFILIAWLFARDRKLRPMTSWALWFVLVWIVIIGSRPSSLWFGGGIQIETPDDYLEGSPLDRNLFLFLIVSGLVVLLRRKVDWGRIFDSNRWVFAFFLYCGISVLWSDYAFVGFKRWIKDFGNVIMVLVILTEKDPIQAIKAVFARYTYFAIPLSVVFIKYFPKIGRYYNRWTWEPAYCGVTTEKNALGCIVFICGLFLIWDLIEIRASGGKKTDVPDTLMRIVLLLMVFWLLDRADSSTALACFILGTGILLFMRLPLAKRQVKYLGTWSLVIGFLIFLLYIVPGVRQAFVGMFQRDITLTGRTDLWADLLSEPINPLLGTGYQSFWLGPKAEHYWKKYSYHPNQAHNGYVETYLNGGIVGVGLLIAMIVFTGSKLKKELLNRSNFGIFCFSFLIVTLFYNWPEAMFNKMTPVWFILLIIALYPSGSTGSMPGNLAQGNRD